MNKLKKIGCAAIATAFIAAASCINTSALTVSDGISADQIITISEDKSSAEVEAVVKNANYYEISGINYSLTVSGNAAIEGESAKTQLTLGSEESDSLNVKVKAVAATGDNSDDTDETAAPTDSQTEPSSTTSPTDTALAESPTSATKAAATLKTPEQNENSAIDTGDDSLKILLAVSVVLLFSVCLIIGIRRKDIRMMSIILCFALVTPIFSASASSLTASAADGGIMSFTDEQVIELSGQEVTLTLTVEYPPQPEIHDNSLEDLDKLNNGDIEIIRNDENEISFLNGHYTDYKVINWETAMTSLQSMESLLNVKDQDITMIAIMTKIDDNGDTYYTFQQTVGSVLLSQSYLTVAADSEGNTLCLSSSIQPSAGTVDFTQDMISAEQADEIVSSAIPILDKTDKEPTLDLEYGTHTICWVVYRQEIDEESGQPLYYKIYVNASSGDLVSITAVTNIYDDRSEGKVYDNDAYFTNVDTQMMSFTDYFGDTVELSVAYDSAQEQYYFCDTQRRIIGFEGYDSEKLDSLLTNYFYFSSPSDVSPVFVSVMNNITKCYDNYSNNGISSLDGNGMPIAVCLGYREYGEECENACYLGNLSGFGVFVFSDFPISVSLDVASHEFTHGVKQTITGPSTYENVTGAIEESYADILGNITEMIVEPEKSDTELWSLAEQGGTPLRCMGDPHKYYQPEYIGDAYYMTSTKSPGEVNDNGGVHINNSILSYVSYQLHQDGLSLRQSYDLWLDTFMVLNPMADYDDIRAYLKYSAQRNNYNCADAIQTLFEDANAVDTDTYLWQDYEPADGYSVLEIKPVNFPDDLAFSFVLRYSDGSVNIAGDKADRYCMIVENGPVGIYAAYKDDPASAPIAHPISEVDEHYTNYNVTENTVIEVDYNELIGIGA